MVYINLSAPPSKRFRYAIARYVAICSGVIALLFSCGPSAVDGLIVPVNINSVESEPSWFFPHISKEVGEIKPPIANRYSSAPILGELRFFAVGTTLNHRPPRLVGTGVRHAMRDFGGIPRFGLETPTGFCSTRCEQVGSSYVQSSANTHAFPLCFYAAPTTTFNLFDGRESPEHLAGEINGAVVQFFCASTGCGMPAIEMASNGNSLPPTHANTGPPCTPGIPIFSPRQDSKSSKNNTREIDEFRHIDLYKTFFIIYEGATV